MSNFSHEISEIESEINRQKLRSIEALKNNSPFEELKKISIRIKDLERKLLNFKESQ